ncbi:hypothetical protein OSCT_0965 [Oscillochloris trichoides DG-6]|uniref:ABC-2 type transport system permease protein n=1 Tax=Oscillochloris trichoides DG-6 TaxID=765420 RepID=E1ICB4_9CHLR|nr:hypothetical protein [Oscillochloris trichoides]EFO81168.1 hypothetical protein OSCT_0965 [Oscillochloris trichoides DG-6]
MLNAIWVLIRTRLIITRNAIWRGSLRRKIGWIVLLALMAFGAFGIYSFVSVVVWALSSPEFQAALQEMALANPGMPSDFRPYLDALPGLVLLGTLFMLLLSSFSSLLSSLYLSGDMDMLLVAPVPMRAVFTVKFFGGLISQYIILFALIGPVLLGYGQGLGYGPLYFVCAGAVLLVLPLFPAGLGTLLLMAVVRVLPARRAREMVSLLGGMIGIGFYLTSQFSAELAPMVASPQSLQALLATNLPVLPSAWAGRTLVAAGQGDLLSLSFYGGIFISASLLVFIACMLVAERLYYNGWSNMATQGGRVRTRAPRREAQLQTLPLAHLLPAPSRALLAKDLRLFGRDLRNLQQLIFPLAIAAIWTFRMITTPAEPEFDQALPGFVVQLGHFVSAGIAFFICLSLSTSLAGTGISREGRGFWIIKAAPISPFQILLGKFALAYLPYPLVGSAFLLILSLLRHTAPLVLLEQWLLLLVTGLGCTAFSMGLGAAFPKLDWENPQQQATWQSGCIGTLFYPAYLTLVVGFIVTGTAVGDLLGGDVLVVLGMRLLGWVIALLITLGVSWVGVLMGTRGLERIEV